MLDNDTKRRIDTARDILVGKVPDPKSQVEQITVALIYKFMDDMDMESIELGGEPSFFTGDYQKYAWRELFKPAIGGTERLLLYSEAIVQMNLNPKLPQLFRDIFKNAYLPYRDPETLTMFLKIIQEFKYDHSERLGDAFEYLLSVLGSQGDAGQFRTPRHIIDFMAAVVQPQKHETIGDPACGTAGFLIASYKHILAENKGQLSPSERLTLAKNLIGYDISPDMVRLSLVNLYLHGFRTPLVYEYDSLSSQDRWGEYFDVILANPPFMTPKGGIKPHNRFGVQSNRAEVLFVDYIVEHLKPDGRAAIIVPEGIIFQGGTAYKALRKMLIEEGYLYAVASLPAGIFQPYSGVKTSILFIDKSIAKRTDKLLFVKINEDGFGLGAQRRAQTANDLPDALQILTDYKRALHRNTAFETDSALAVVIDKESVAKNGEYNLSADRYKVVDTEGAAKFEMVELRDIIKLSSGSFLSKEQQVDGEYLVYGGNGVTGRHNEYIFENQTLIIGRVGAYCGAVHLTQPKSWITDNALYVAEYLKEIDQIFLSYILTHANLNQYAKVGGQPSISQTTVYEIKIPLPPLSIQRQIVEKIESYQRIIDGAKQVVNNYKPMIEVDAAWEMVALGALLNFIGSGGTPLGGKEVYLEKGILFIRSQNVLWGECDFSDAVYISTQIHSEMKRSHVKKNDVMLNITGASIGRCAIFELEEEANVNQHVVILRTIERVNAKFLMTYILSDKFQNQIMSVQSGASRQALNYQQIKELQIPLPPLSIQAEIVSAIEAEQALVNGNKALIVLMEAKIKGVIGQVWAV
jgi:type I restriction enzyme M protein